MPNYLDDLEAKLKAANLADDDVDVFKPLANSLPWLIARLREAWYFTDGQLADTTAKEWMAVSRIQAMLSWLARLGDEWAALAAAEE